MFNNDWDEHATCQMIANGHLLKTSKCGWITNGRRCNAAVQGMDFGEHLKNFHIARNDLQPQCQWDTCGESLLRGCIVRHTQEKHLEWKWPCTRCDALFTRGGVLDKHRAGSCKGTVA